MAHKKLPPRDTTTDRDRELQAKVQYLMSRTLRYMKKLWYEDSLCFVCHPTCRAIAKIIPELKLVDGVYFGISEQKGEKGEMGPIREEAKHSWLVTPDGAILDPCPVGIIADRVLLVICKGLYAPFGQGLYREDPKITAKISNRDLWRKTRVLLKLMKATFS